MRVAGRLSTFLTLFALALCSCKASDQARPSRPAPLTTITTAKGGIIEYGRVDGATTLPAAMAKILSQVHQACGEKPRVGQVFRVKGTNSAGVFFAVVNHARGNRQMAGMVIVTQAGPNQIDVGLVSDSAYRFRRTANPMLRQLFAAWHPGEPQAPSGASGGSGSASASNASNVSTVQLHAITAPDNSATIAVPDGWTMDPRSGQGAINVHGPNGERLSMNMVRPAVDPTNPFQVKMARQRYSVVVPGTVVYPFHGDLVRDFANIFQAWRRASGQGPAPIQVDKIDPLPTAQGNHCVHAVGHLDPDGRGMQAFDDMMCAIDPIPSFGGYAVMLHHTLLPSAVAATEHALMMSIVSTYKPNEQVIDRQLADLRRKKQRSDHKIIVDAHQYIDQIHRIGQQATARMNAIQAANDAQHAGYWARQNSNARNSAGFSDYLLDQSVLQNNNVGGTGAVGHAKVWNSTANALVQANPNKYEIVNPPNYRQGVDY